MAKVRKPHTTKSERHAILKAAAKAKGGKLKKTEKGGKQKTPIKTPPEKPGRKKRKLVSRGTTPVAVRKARGPDLKPRKRRTSMAINQKYEGDDVKGAKGAEYDAEVKAKADAKAYADAEVKAKAEAKDAGVQWTPWPKYGTKPTDAEAKARAKAEAEAKARAEEAGDDPWTAWPSPEPKAEEGGATGGTGGTGATGATGPATVQVWDASSGQMKTMVAP